MTKNGKKVLGNLEEMVGWLEDYQKKTFGVSGDWTGGDRDLSDYFSDFYQEFNGFERSSDEAELLDEIHRSQIVFISDFNNLRQSQKFTAELISKFSGSGSCRRSLAVEFISPGHQKVLNAYQSGKIGQKVFLKKINFKSWNDPRHWEGYRKILLAARKNNIKVFGIKTEGRTKNQSEREINFGFGFQEP